MTGDKVTVEPGNVLLAQAEQQLPQNFSAGSQNDHSCTEAKQDACKTACDQYHAAGKEQNRERIHKSQ